LLNRGENPELGPVDPTVVKAWEEHWVERGKLDRRIASIS